MALNFEIITLNNIMTPHHSPSIKGYLISFSFSVEQVELKSKPSFKMATKKSSPNKKEDDTPKKRLSFTMQDKLVIIHKSSKGKTNAQVARELNMDETTVCSILDELQLWYFLEKVQDEIKRALKKNPKLKYFFVLRFGTFLLRDPSFFGLKVLETQTENFMFENLG